MCWRDHAINRKEEDNGAREGEEREVGQHEDFFNLQNNCVGEVP